VETVLLGAKYAWKNERDTAASIGTQAHNWIEAYLKGEEPVWPTDPQVANSCTAALEWINSVKWETIAIEHQIYIPELEVAGICDWYARINGQLAVPDWKTSKSLHGTYAYQTAAYLRALEAEFGEKIPDRWLIRIDKETGIVEPRYLPEEEIEKDYAVFTSAVTIYRREAELRRAWVNSRNSL
jgi:ATP-dependent exoDNAse (exonuclease V) beta subunit